MNLNIDVLCKLEFLCDHVLSDHCGIGDSPCGLVNLSSGQMLVVDRSSLPASTTKSLTFNSCFYSHFPKCEGVDKYSSITDIIAIED